MKKRLTTLPFCCLILLSSCSRNNSNGKIDRFALVNRHNIEVTEFNPLSSLAVANGNFAFTTYITGLQTFNGKVGLATHMGM